MGKIHKLETLRICKILTLGMFLVGAGAVADGTHPLDRKVATACARANHVSLPLDEGAVSANERTTIQNCIKQFRLSLLTCSQKLGIIDNRSIANENVPKYRQCENQAYAAIK